MTKGRMARRRKPPGRGVVARGRESVGSLGLIVLIRTFLSFSLEAEIEGQLPWRRQEKRPI